LAAGGLFEGGLFDETPMDPNEPDAGPSGGSLGEPMHMDSDDDFGGPPSVGGNSSCGPMSPYNPEPPVIQPEAAAKNDNIFNRLGTDENNEAGDQTTLIQNEEESFALAPIETPVARGKLINYTLVAL
jgi:hypothetical protein